MTRTILDVHILHTVPPSNINRDDSGSPKTAIYGGVRRARVSSQSWKRAVRLAFRRTLDDSQLGERTKRIGEAIAARIADLDPELKDKASALAAEVLKASGLVKKEAAAKKEAAKKGKESAQSGDIESTYLLFLSHRQQENLARAAIEAERAGAKLDTKQLQKLADTDHSIDIAMFGRMLADVPDLNVDAAVQVAHALSVHAVDNEFDYYTAVDDRKHDNQETGAGMIGTVEFNSSTLYRYAAIDVDRLHDTLGDAAATQQAVEAFLRAFTTSMPSGKRNTFANGTRPDAVLVQLRDTQPINLIGAFEEPVQERQFGDRSGVVAAAAEKLAEHAGDIEQAYGDPAVATWVTHVGSRTAALAPLGEVMPLPELVSAVGTRVADRLGGTPA
ncbi:type I-E CRISPR-associated protein Cas7/Cse4/CasC [Micromonospora endophytica]|uniref:Type I-E CRISPR-associated protein Cas7/Cse4/CasC n=1 Tax=Micromonospora endophytica TaxID=515350 RepID=A0A2W2CEV5_9ACTN|nr:type I-E CRISPR-associated protein Cas7/Cse4/CasC [Micromonospora endophytica]PZF97042.1 type I-E CRISPR-associated protein Cas7/Cse4/CasC [Micromonospora endophytica]RIW40955.1 type I-E CRISPR-associated protein Cas7/Cse4/CasC [Micromonospora endophytica]BCJ58923.1 type I-E CRISPR-associated protein Cas7/Cse4/CasC [Micromonospora endophytica]